MAVVTFSKPALIKWAGTPITDHNRSALAISINRIETSQRMANGTLRKYVVGSKRSFDLSWTDIPSDSNYTVDGFWGGNDLWNFYITTNTAFPLTITAGDGTTQIISVMFSDFSNSIKKRGRYDFWDVSATMEEV